ncbi:hypothetical protein Tco_1470909, partial [Tanacetum coccineum]
DGQKSFNDEKYTSYIAGMKAKMRAPSDVCGGITVANHDSFSDMISSFINHAKLKLINTIYGLSDRVIALGLRDFMLSVLGESMQYHRLLLYRGRNRRAGVPCVKSCEEKKITQKKEIFGLPDIEKKVLTVGILILRPGRPFSYLGRLHLIW